jgi:hypothetical protein
MDLNKKLDFHNRIVEEINKNINNLIKEDESEEAAKAAAAKEEATKSAEGEDTGDEKVDTSELEKSVSRLRDIGKGLFRDKNKSVDSKTTSKPSILLSHGKIDLKGIGDAIDSVSGKNSARYVVDSYQKDGNGWKLLLLGKDNKNIRKEKEDINLIIKIPYSNGVFYKSDFTAKVIEQDVNTKDEEDLGKVNMRIVSHSGFEEKKG